MPSFSTRVTTHEGGEILEILCDGKPWGETYTWDDHFRFGPFKAHLIVAAESIVSDFLESDGARPSRGETIVAREDRVYPAFSARCSTYDSFIVRGRRIDRPYLQLKRGPGSIAFGVLKAEALIVLMEKVKIFAWSHPT